MCTLFNYIKFIQFTKIQNLKSEKKECKITLNKGKFSRDQRSNSFRVGHHMYCSRIIEDETVKFFNFCFSFSQDNCPRHFNPAQYNNDGDPYGNDCDNCPYVTNKFQSDNDKDGIGDVCDKDVDGDGKMRDWGLVGMFFSEVGFLNKDLSYLG